MSCKKSKLQLYLEPLEARRLLSVYADFNGDGFADLAIGVHGEDNLAGAVSVIYGTSSGLSAGGKFTQHDQFWTQDSPNVADASEAGDQFGRTLAAGDFNSDGYSDLAIGIPFEDGVTQDSGVVQVLYGSATGLTATGTQIWHQDLLGRMNEKDDHFGAALTVGDFNNDEHDDLAVARPGEAYGNSGDDAGNDTPNVGGVDVIYGSALGLTDLGNQSLFCAIGGTLMKNKQYGASLAAGDFDHDGFDDLAIGAPGYQTSLFNKESGAAQVLYGTFDGFPCDYAGFTQESEGISGGAEENDRFGFSLAAGDFNGDDVSDLAIGVPFEDLVDTADAGAAHVLYGASGSGISAVNSQLWTQDALADAPEAGDLFGVALVSGDFNGDGRDELAIGVSREDLGAAVDAGAVHVIFGAATGLILAGNQFYHQDVADIEDVAETQDQFGFALAADDFNGNGQSDLAVGVIRENNSGAVSVIYGTPSGLTAANDEIWTQDSLNIEDQAEANDFFGVALPGTSGIGNAGYSGEWLNLTWSPKNNGRGNLRGVVTVFNPGIELTPSSVIRFFLSDDATWSPDDLLLKEVNLGPLPSQQIEHVRLQMKLNTGENPTGKFGIVVLDADNALSELNEDNNFVVFGPISERSAPRSNQGRCDFIPLLTADFDSDPWLTRPTKRRHLSGRR